MLVAAADRGDTLPMDDLVVDVTEDGTRIRVVGDVDAHSVGALSAAFDGAAPDVVIDLGGCTFMDSSGVAALVAAKAGPCPELTVSEMSRAVELVLTVTGLAGILRNQ